MPNFDGTGPMGRGPGSGRGNGSCAGTAYPRGRFARRSGYCPRYADLPDTAASLEQEEKLLEQELAMIKKQRQDLQSNKN